MPETRRRVSILDLELRDLRRLELEVIKLPASRWGEAPSLSDVLIGVYQAATGTPMAEVERMTLRELQELVDLEGEDEGPADPT